MGRPLLLVFSLLLISQCRWLGLPAMLPSKHQPDRLNIVHSFHSRCIYATCSITHLATKNYLCFIFPVLFLWFIRPTLYYDKGRDKRSIKSISFISMYLIRKQFWVMLRLPEPSDQFLWLKCPQTGSWGLGKRAGKALKYCVGSAMVS